MTLNLENEVHRLNAVIENQAKALGHWRQKSDQDAGELARLRAALERTRQGYRNILEVRKIAGSDRYGNLTREEIETVIGEIDGALNHKGAL